MNSSSISHLSSINVGHSPDADDAFMFYGITEKKVDMKGYSFNHLIRDIQTLNEMTLKSELHVSAVSVHTYAYLTETYTLLPSGASMGDGYGPILITKNERLPSGHLSLEEKRRWLLQQKIAIPGLMTSAYLATRLFLEKDFNYVSCSFDKIFSKILSNEVSVGLIIHEQQLSYAHDGLVKILDLGEWWKLETDLPLPLGANVIRKDIPYKIQCDISHILSDSISYGLNNRLSARMHSSQYARGIQDELVDRFIQMYVNHFTLDYGVIGRMAIREFLNRSYSAKIIPKMVDIDFLNV